MSRVTVKRIWTRIDHAVLWFWAVFRAMSFCFLWVLFLATEYANELGEAAPLWHRWIVFLSAWLVTPIIGWLAFGYRMSRVLRRKVHRWTAGRVFS